MVQGPFAAFVPEGVEVSVDQDFGFRGPYTFVRADVKMFERYFDENVETCALTASIRFTRYRAVLEEIPAEVLDHPISVRGEMDGRSDLPDFSGAFQDLHKEIRERRRQWVVSISRRVHRDEGSRAADSR